MGFEREKPWDSEEEIATNFGRLPGHQSTAEIIALFHGYFSPCHTLICKMMAVQQKRIRYKVVNGAPSDSQFACQPKWSLIKSMVGQTFAFDLIDFLKKMVWPSVKGDLTS